MKLGCYTGCYEPRHSDQAAAPPQAPRAPPGVGKASGARVHGGRRACSSHGCSAIQLVGSVPGSRGHHAPTHGSSRLLPHWVAEPTPRQLHLARGWGPVPVRLACDAGLPVQRGAHCVKRELRARTKGRHNRTRARSAASCSAGGRASPSASRGARREPRHLPHTHTMAPTLSCYCAIRSVRCEARQTWRR